MSALKLDPRAQYESLIQPQFIKGMDWEKICIVENTLPAAVLDLVLTKPFDHVCQADHPYFMAELNAAAYLTGAHCEFLKYPLSSILATDRVSEAAEQKVMLEQKIFHSSDDKPQLIDMAERNLRQIKVSNSVQADAVVVADELLTNAIFNAPYVDPENSASGTSRSTPHVKMHNGKFGRFFMGATETRLVVGCSDPYGVLNLAKLFSRIKKCYDTGVASNINMSQEGGAGIGTFMIFNAVDSFYVSVVKGQITMICCVLPVRMSSRQREGLPKNIHIVNK